MQSLESRVESGCLIIEICGEFRRFRCGEFMNRIRHELSSSITRVILDVRGLTFMTASALAELVELHQLLAEHGCRLIVAGPTLQMRKMLIMSFLDKIIVTAPTMEDAVAQR